MSKNQSRPSRKIRLSRRSTRVIRAGAARDEYKLLPNARPTILLERVIAASNADRCVLHRRARDNAARARCRVEPRASLLTRDQLSRYSTCQADAHALDRAPRPMRCCPRNGAKACANESFQICGPTMREFPMKQAKLRSMLLILAWESPRSDTVSALRCNTALPGKTMPSTKKASVFF